MKIKEVIAKTDLTDRAIRLYIENGLVHPRFTETYNGRKNIDFTEDDLKTLQNIATLRKADFSIAEIKSITEGSQNCKSVLEEFIKSKSDKIENDTKIVEALSPLLGEEETDINSICERLNAVTENKDVPEADTKTPLWERIEKRFFYVVGSLGIIWFILFVLCNIYLMAEVHEIKYPYFNFEQLHYMYIFCALPLIIPVILFCVYRKHLTLHWRIPRIIISLLLTAAMVWGMYFSFAYTFISKISPFYSSQTDNPSHYLNVDKGYGDIPDIFPDKIPEYADKEKVEMWRPKRFPESTQYYYNFTLNNNSHSELYAQWYIPKAHYWLSLERPATDEFDAMVEEYKNKNSINNKKPVFKTKGTWHLIYYADSHEADFSKDYNYIVFAYNTNRRLVRFIQAENYAGKCGGNGTVVPHYLTLDWYS